MTTQLSKLILSIIITLFVLHGCTYSYNTINTSSNKKDVTLPFLPDLNWVLIKANRFYMGSTYGREVACTNGTPPSDLNIKESKKVEYCKKHGPSTWFKDELPRHLVQVENNYWISDTEITVDQFKYFVDETGYITVAERDRTTLGEVGRVEEIEVFGSANASWRKPWGSINAVDSHPVVHIAWEDAMSFCKWLSHKAQIVVRLPSEVEWEYAAKGLKNNADYRTGTFSWGLSEPSDIPVANFADKSFGDLYTKWKYPVDLSHDDGFPRLSPVRSFPANEFGLYDMSGNVWEWVADVYWSEAYSSSSKISSIDSIGSSGFNHVMRGGSFDFELPFLRVEKRRSFGFVRRSINIRSSISVGFRIVTSGKKLAYK